VHAIRLPGPDANLALAYNDHDRPFHGMAKGRGGAEGKRRDTLMLAVSPDSGHSWKQARGTVWCLLFFKFTYFNNLSKC
jgi:hypothetical protein